MRSLLHSVIAIGLLAAPLAAQNEGAFVRVVPGNRVQLLDLRTRTVREIYESPTWHAADAMVEPGGQRIALLEWTQGPVIPHSELVVLDSAGRVTARPAREVQKYVWCGNGCLAYITGTYREGRDGFRPESLYHHDLRTGTKTAIRGVRSPIDLVWATFDSALYVRTRLPERGIEVDRYDLSSRILTKTTLKSIRLSPTGRYYLYTPPLTDSVFVLETATNADVSLGKLRRNATPIQWADGERDLLLAVQHEPRRAAQSDGPRPVIGDMNPPLTYLLYDVARGKVVRSMRGRLTVWTSPRREKILETSGRAQLLKE